MPRADGPTLLTVPLRDSPTPAWIPCPAWKSCIAILMGLLPRAGLSKSLSGLLVFIFLYFFVLFFFVRCFVACAHARAVSGWGVGG